MSPERINKTHISMAQPVTTIQYHLPNLFHHDSTVTFPTKPTTFRYHFQLTRRTITNVSLFTASLNKSRDAKSIKNELLDAIAPLDCGALASPEDQQTINQIVQKLEVANPTNEPLKSTLLNGKWELLYTTSKSTLKTKRPKFLRSRVNYQAINSNTLRAQNMESFPTFNQAIGDLIPLNAKKVVVIFTYFKIFGWIYVKAPDTARGSLEITYLDEELRISRGDKGNLFILRMTDPFYRVPV